MPDFDVVITEGPDVVVAVEESEVTVLVDVASQPSTIEVQVPGPPGSPGDGTMQFVHDQAIPSTLWTVTHNLGRRPAAVSIIDSGDNEVEGEVQHSGVNELVVSFGSAFSGKALCT